MACCTRQCRPACVWGRLWEADQCVLRRFGAFRQLAFTVAFLVAHSHPLRHAPPCLPLTLSSYSPHVSMWTLTGNTIRPGAWCACDSGAPKDRAMRTLQPPAAACSCARLECFHNAHVLLPPCTPSCIQVEEKPARHSVLWLMQQPAAIPQPLASCVPKCPCIPCAPLLFAS